MAYNPNIPASTDDPGVSQSQMRENFSQINTQYAINHVALTAGGDNGKHTKIYFPDVLGADPNLPAPQSSIYPKTSGGAPQLFFQNGNLAANVKQLTGLPITTSGTNYGITTPWGLIINYGTAPFTTVGAAVTFAIPFNSLKSLNVTPSGVVTTWNISAVTNNGFTGGSNPNATFYYFAIGT